MGGVEVILVLLLVAVAVLASAARRMNIPYPIVLVIGGAALGLLPTLSDARLDPQLVLVIFLPPLLYSGAFFANLRELRTDLRAISLLSVGLVLATTTAVAVVAHAVIDDLPWAACFALGAIVGPTDPVAAIAIAGRLGVPRRAIAILEGESLFNDATALVIYRIALGVVAGESFSLLHAIGQFAVDAAGGIAIGLVAGVVITEIRRRVEDPLVENTISLLSGYAAYVPAERAGASAVLAAVTCGIYIGWQAPLIASPATRLQGFAMWELLVFLLNAFLFVLVGLQLHNVLEDLSGMSTAQLIWWGALVSGVVIGVRLLWQHTIVFVIRTLDRRASQRARRGSWRQRTLVGWAGMRGAVSLAAALALPDTFPERGLLVFLTFTVIFATLVLQGLTLPTVIRWLRVPADDGDDREELKARLLATKAALARLEDLAGEEWTRDDTIERMAGAYRYRKNRLAARAGKVEDDGYEDRSVAYQTVVREVLEAQRREIVRLRNEGVISNDVMHRIERELDLEDQRLEI
jgi:CPA1 family monovalent cation:H+ antiporter